MESTIHSLTQSLEGMLAGEVSFWELMGAFSIAYLGGVFTSLTPCVYPMIPVTVSMVGGLPLEAAKKAGSKAERRRLWLQLALRSAVYVLGMALIYASLGVVAALTGQVFGKFTQTPEWYVALGSILSIAALIMLDVIPFDPVGWWNRLRHRFASKKANGTLAKQRDEATLIGAFTLGASSGLVAAPCTTPILTAVLAFIAQTHSVTLGFFLMVAFAFGIGTLLLLIALFTGTLELLPKSGSWMKKIKWASGGLLGGFALYLFYQAAQWGGN